MFPSYILGCLPSKADTEFALEGNISPDGTAQINGSFGIGVYVADTGEIRAKYN